MVLGERRALCPLRTTSQSPVTVFQMRICVGGLRVRQESSWELR